MKDEGTATGWRRSISRGFTWLQDLIYIALGVLLAVSAAAVLVHGGVGLVRAIAEGIETKAMVSLLDQILLGLMIVELLYTVQVSFREHALVPEPFILVALIATVRRILVITAEFGAQGHPGDDVIRYVLSELGLLTVLVIVLVASLGFLHLRVGTSPAIRRDG